MHYIKHKTRDTKINQNLILQIVYQQAIVGSRPKTKQLISSHMVIPTYSRTCALKIIFVLG